MLAANGIAMPATVSFSIAHHHIRSLRLKRYPVTRTMPVGNGGKFTKEAREMYNLVLDMQKASVFFVLP